MASATLLGVEVGDDGGGIKQLCFPPLRAFKKSDPLTLRVFGSSDESRFKSLL
jgi:hypothetical protein